MPRNASGSIFGWEFQICMSIILSLQYIEKLSKVEIEGLDQDVELYMSGSSKILCQSKGYSGQAISSGSTGWQEKLESAMDSLFQNFVEKTMEIDELIYAVNYTYPLGKSKGIRENFGEDFEGKIAGNELTNVQKESVYNHLKKGKWVSENKNDMELDSPLFIGFLDKLKIMNNNFTNFEDSNRKYSKLEVLIQRFLKVNRLSDIDAKLLMDYWKNICFDNATHSKLRIDKKNFLRAIYTIHVVTSDNNTEMTRSNFSYISKLFQDLLNSGAIGQEFENKIMIDILIFFNLSEITQFQYKQSKVDEFIEEKYEEYKSFFSIDDLREQQIIDLTKYALKNWLENIELINYLDSEEIKGVG